MRALLAFALLLALVPSAAAQAVLPPTAATFLIDPFRDPAPPEGGAITTPATLRVACEADRAAPPTRVTFALAQRPAWADVTLEPSAMETTQPQTCTDGAIAFVTMLYARASTQAPAFREESVEVEATIVQPMRPPVAARGMIPLTAAFFSIVDVSARRTVIELPAGGSGAFDLVVTNLGNAATRVDFDARSIGEGVRLQTPSQVLLQSKQAGGNTISSNVRLLVLRAEGSNEPVPVSFQWRAQYALDPDLRGDAGELKLMVVAPGASSASDAATVAGEAAARVPMPPAILAAALAFALALVRKRR